MRYVYSKPLTANIGRREIAKSFEQKEGEGEGMEERLPATRLRCKILKHGNLRMVFVAPQSSS
jgi:hypothetical protein